MRIVRNWSFILFCLAISFAVHAQTRHLTAAEARGHVGENGTVCGKVVSTHYADRSRGQPTFLNLDKPVIWGSDRGKCPTRDVSKIMSYVSHLSICHPPELASAHAN
jgi:hypothetical protein